MRLTPQELVTGAWSTGFKVLAVAFAMIGTFGLGMGLGKTVTSRRRADSDQSRGKEIAAVIVAALGFATALLNFLAAGP